MSLAPLEVSRLERTGVELIGLSKRVVPGLIAILEMIEESRPRLH
jgi:hypothetical protein